MVNFANAPCAGVMLGADLQVGLFLDISQRGGCRSGTGNQVDIVPSHEEASPSLFGKVFLPLLPLRHLDRRIESDREGNRIGIAADNSGPILQAPSSS